MEVSINLPDGRPLSVSEGGDPGGVPVIYPHGHAVEPVAGSLGT